MEKAKVIGAFLAAALAIAGGLHMIVSHSPFTFVGAMGWLPVFFGAGIGFVYTDVALQEFEVPAPYWQYVEDFRNDACGMIAALFGTTYVVLWPLRLLVGG